MNYMKYNKSGKPKVCQYQIHWHTNCWHKLTVLRTRLSLNKTNQMTNDTDRETPKYLLPEAFRPYGHVFCNSTKHAEMTSFIQNSTIFSYLNWKRINTQFIWYPVGAIIRTISVNKPTGTVIIDWFRRFRLVT